MCINLYVQFQKGPCSGQIMIIMCLGIESFLFHMSEIAQVEHVFVIGYEVFSLSEMIKAA